MRVLISGGGIAGPTLAWFLARSGHSVTILEKMPSMRATGQNIDIEGSAITVVKKMRLLDEVKKWNSTEEGTQLINSNGKPFAPFPVREGGLSPTSQYEILRGDLAAIFYDATKTHPSIEYLFGTTIRQVLSNDEKSVKVEYNTGEVHPFDILVAADGQWSPIRKQCFDPSSITVRELGMFVAHWSIPRTDSDNNWWNVYAGLKRRVVTMRPDPHNTLRVMTTYMPPTEEKRKEWAAATRADRKTQEELVRRDFADVGWQMERMLDHMSDAHDFYYWPMQQIRMEKWSTGRIVCLGDAAYAPSPLTGSGTPLAIIGAHCLAGEIVKLAPDDHPEKAFEAYEAIYHPWVNEKQDSVPPGLPGIAHANGRVHRFLITTFMSTLSWLLNIPWVRRRIGMVDPELHDDGFPLPKYPLLDDLIAKSIAEEDEKAR